MFNRLFWLLFLWQSSTWAVAQTCPQAQANRILHGNDVKAIFNNGGDMFWDLNADNTFKVPYRVNGPTPSTLFAGALWLGAYDSGGNLKVAAQTYRQNGNDYWAGPLDRNGQTINQGCSNFDYLWQVRRWEIEAHIADYTSDGTINGPVPEAILKWPGRGNPQFRAQMGFPLPDQDLAPFFDRNNNGFYDPMRGDYPVYEHGNPNAIAEDLLWWVYNDAAAQHTQSNGAALGAEVQASAWSFYCGGNTLLNQTIFVRHKIINKSGSTWRNFKTALWTDPDLGCGRDDYVGTDVASRSVYWYNGDNNDDVVCSVSGTLGYGQDPPAQTITLLNQPLSSSLYTISGSTVPPGDPTTALGYYRLLSGIWTDGTPLTAGGSGYNAGGGGTVVQHAFPDPPLPVAGWSMLSANLNSNDLRSVPATHKDSVVDGEAFVLDVAYAFHRQTGNDNFQNALLAIQQVQQVQAFYDSSFVFPNCTPRVAPCTNDCVYPGDMNNNGIANDFDVLDWGVAAGQSLLIPSRTFPNDDWFPYTPPNTGRIAYIDANGNGRIEDGGWDANNTNLDRTHSLYTGVAEGSNALGKGLEIKRWYHNLWPFVGGTPQYDTLLHRAQNLYAPVLVGDSTLPMDLYGLTFEVVYDPLVLEPDFPRSFSYWTSASSQGFGNKERARPQPGLLNYVATYSDGPGFFLDYQRPLGHLRFRVRADAPIHAPVMTTDICIRNFKAVDSTGAILPIGANCITIEYYDSNYTIGVTTLDAEVYKAVLYPNPTEGSTTLSLELDRAETLQVRLLNSMGQVVYEHPSQDLPTGQHQLSLPTAGLPPGVYHCHLASERRQQTLSLIKSR